ncbi:hypothetical protein D8M04_10025 [Oceanobacillus piezotolerans]|uniref:Cell-wall binding lipoprotein n=2 Tax=Oceanobacillus piezotolerans TaxID=2448030 RepID=A0A498D778_9BACI|nr:hypothetical protein D8M04_10025 [Oceanobacillus piezotolerans]
MFFITILFACNGVSTEEEIHNHLEKAVSLESDFVDKQNEITQLEVREQEIYSEIINLDMEEYKEITELSEEAITIIEERASLIEVEKESIDASQEEFNKIEELISKLDNEALKKKAHSMYDTMQNRYQSYTSLHEAYNESLKLEKELYNMLQTENLEQEELTNHIHKTNESYQSVLEANDNFNQYTVKYNELKKEFYELADLNVTFKEDDAANA